MTQLAAGLGLIRDVVIDQHFGQRNRYGRLLMLVAQSPRPARHRRRRGHRRRHHRGATAPRCCEVVGRGVVTVFDGRNVVSNAHEARRTAPLLASGVVLHVLPAGSRVRPDHARRWSAQAPVVGPVARPEELAVAGRDLKRLARDIAAGDVSPSRAAPPTRPPDPDRRRPRMSTPVPRPVDPRDPGLPRRERLVLRQGRSTSSSTSARSRSSRPTRCPGFTDNLLQHAARPAGALVLARPPRRLRRAAQRGHLARARRRARRARAAAGRRPRHPARQDPPGQGPERAATTSSTGTSTRQVGLAAARLAVRLVNHLVQADPELDWDAGARGVHPARGAHRVRPVDAGDHRRGRLPRHPLDPAQPALAGAARPGRAPEADPGHDDLGDQRDRGRRRLRQGPHHPAAGRRRAAGAQAGVGAHRRPGRRGRPSGSATPSSSSRSTATTAAASASTSRTPTTCARRSRSPRTSPAAAG